MRGDKVEEKMPEKLCKDWGGRRVFLYAYDVYVVECMPGLRNDFSGAVTVMGFQHVVQLLINTTS